MRPSSPGSFIIIIHLAAHFESEPFLGLRKKKKGNRKKEIKKENRN